MNQFSEMPLHPDVLRAVSELGFQTPSPIQAQTLPLLLGQDTDFIGLASTGTGKTAAFTLPMLERIDASKKGVQALVLCPTRELSLQVANQISLLGKYRNIKALPIYGGAGYDEQLYGLRKGMPVVVGTPGRLIDHLERGTLKLNDVRIVILDEADEMISMGFREAIEQLLSSVPREEAKIWLFSATMSSAVRKVADEFLSSPKKVEINRTEVLSGTVEQIFYMTHEKNKPEVLCKLIDAADDFYGIIFCQTKSLVVDLTRYLGDRSYKVDCLHGDMSQSAREAAMLSYRQRKKNIMVCTDVASRGLDVKDVTHVINYSLPREMDSYIHRIGRTARSGRAGIAMNLVTPSHRHLISKIERFTKSRMTEGSVPNRRDIGMKKIAALLNPFKDQPGFERALGLMDDSWKSAVAGMTPEEVAARFLTMMFPWVFSEKDRPQMSRSDAPQNGQDQSERRGSGRPDRRDRHDRRERNDRSERPERRDRPGRFERSESSERTDQQPRTSYVGANSSSRYSSKESKEDRRDEKRREKRDFKKRFKRPFKSNRSRVRDARAPQD